jgi:hypothetical protein
MRRLSGPLPSGHYACRQPAGWILRLKMMKNIQAYRCFCHNSAITRASPAAGTGFIGYDAFLLHSF